VSLVSEALKKAERDAAAREAREHGLPVPLETPMQPYRARRGQRRGTGARLGLAVAGGAAVLALAVLIARAALEERSANKGGTGSPSAPALTAPSAEASAPPAASPASSPIPSAPATAASPPLVSPQSASGPAATPPSEGEPRTPASSYSPLPKTASDEPEARPSEREPTPLSGPPVATAKVREFVRRIDFPGGSKLELGGIAYSENAPFAYLNGKLLKVGEGTSGYTLVKIERDHVVVSGEAGNLMIRLKPR
jgi:hypothetical protein